MSDIIKTNDAFIQNPVDIDDMLVHIAEIDQRIAHYKELKKHRAQIIDSAIDSLEDKKTQYKEAIRLFMAENGERALNYPGVGKVSRRSGTRKWVVKDEEALLTYLKTNAGLSPQLLEKVVVTEEKIVKTELNKVLDDLNKHGALKTDSVELEASPEGVTISFDKGDSLLQAARDLRSGLFESTPESSTVPTPSAQSFDEL